MILDYLDKEINIGDLVLYVASGSGCFDHGVVIGAEAQVAPSGFWRYKIKLARMEIETWKWCRKTNTNVATNDWKVKKIQMNSPDNIVVINADMLRVNRYEWAQQLLALQQRVLSGERI